MVQEHCLVTLEQEPVLDLTDDLLLTLSFFIFLSNALVDVLFLGLIGFTGMYHTDVLICNIVRHLHLLDDLLIFEVNLVHLCTHI